MAKTEIQSVDDYIATHPEPARGVLERVRSIIRRAIPRAQEGISYKIPAYRLPAGPVIYFAGWKQHFSLYPVTGGVIAMFAHELAPYEVERGTIRFPLNERVPSRLIAGIVKLRAQEITQAASTNPRLPGLLAASAKVTKSKLATKKVAAKKRKV